MEKLARLGRKIDTSIITKVPSKVVLQGRYARLEPLDTEKHYRVLYENFIQTPHLFDFLLEHQLSTLEDFKLRCLEKENDSTCCHFVISKTDIPEDYVGLSCFANADIPNKKI